MLLASCYYGGLFSVYNIYYDISNGPPPLVIDLGQ